MENKTLAACLERIPNRFELVSVGWKRAHQLIEGSPPFIPREGEKAEAQALREIAEGAFERPEGEEPWKPIMEPIYEPAPMPAVDELPRDEDREEESE